LSLFEKLLPRAHRLSLALRLTLLFAVATSLLLVALGSGLGFMLRDQLELRDREEIDGKTMVIQHLLRELNTVYGVEHGVVRVSDLVIGHPHLLVALREGHRWLVPMRADIAERLGPSLAMDAPLAPKLITYEIGPDHWWLQRVQHITDDGVVYDAYVGLHVNPAQLLVRNFFATILGAGLIGIVASALLGWIVARRGLAPITAIGREAERVTADRLGTPLRAEDVPTEIRGMVESINRMLDRLRASFRALEEFSADIAHELRTPLNSLLMRTQVTLSRPRSIEDYQDALHANLAGLEQLTRMVSDMLFLARADRGMLALDREQVALHAEVDSVAEFFAIAAGERNTTIHVHGKATVSCDRLLAHRAFTNLLSNAVRYAPPASNIEVVIAQEGPGGATVSITNPAPSMTDADLQRLFGRFYRGPEGAHPSVEGAGLGLSIVVSIMRLLGGSVGASSTNGAVTFRLQFPADVPVRGGTG